MKALFVIGIICTLLLFGCASQPSAPANAPPTGQPPAATNPAAGASQPARPSAPANAPPIAQPPAVSAYDALVGALRVNSGWKVVYDVTAGTEGTYETTQYQKGGNFRTDMAASGMQIRTYAVSGKISSCVLAGSAWTCTDMTSQAGGETGDLGQQVESDPAKYTITADGTMSVAGTTANCYKVVSSDGTARYCTSPDGVPLYVKASAQGTDTIMQAKSYSTSVADSDFALPG